MSLKNGLCWQINQSREDADDASCRLSLTHSGDFNGTRGDYEYTGKELQHW